MARSHLVAIVLCAAIATAGAPAVAATVDASATVLSDYRFRGVSLSDRQPVGEATVDLSLGPWFAGVEGVTESRPRNILSSARTTPEIDLSAGWSRTFGLLTPSAGVIGYFHPGGGEVGNAELFANVAASLGPATVTVGANLAPDQAAAPEGNLYLFLHAAAGIPTTPLTLRAGVGREAGAYAGGGVKTDWSIGVEARVLRFVTLGLDYIGNDLPAGAVQRLNRNHADGVVARAGIRF